MSENLKSDINALYNWLSANDFSNFYAVTITMKQNWNGMVLDQTLASKNLRHFINLMNQAVYGNAYRRHGKSLQVIPILEQSAWDRLHYHISIEKPDRLSEADFMDLLKESWSRTDFARKQMEIKKIFSRGWIQYCLKNPSSAQTIDIENLKLHR
jgi:hypothetical protein